MAPPTSRGRASIRVARWKKVYQRETARTEAVGLQPKRSVTIHCSIKAHHIYEQDPIVLSLY